MIFRDHIVIGILLIVSGAFCNSAFASEIDSLSKSEPYTAKLYAGLGANVGLEAGWLTSYPTIIYEPRKWIEFNAEGGWLNRSFDNYQGFESFDIKGGWLGTGVKFKLPILDEDEKFKLSVFIGVDAGYGWSNLKTNEKHVEYIPNSAESIVSYEVRNHEDYKSTYVLFKVGISSYIGEKVLLNTSLSGNGFSGSYAYTEREQFVFAEYSTSPNIIDDILSLNVAVVYRLGDN